MEHANVLESMASGGISEKTLIGIAVIGGSVGAILGMYVFHHKTRHWYFRYGLPVILVLQIVLVFLELKK